MPRTLSYALSKYLDGDKDVSRITVMAPDFAHEADKIALLSDSEDTYTDNDISAEDFHKFTTRDSRHFPHPLQSRKKHGWLYYAFSIGAILIALAIAFSLGHQVKVSKTSCYPKQHCRSHPSKSTSLDTSALPNLTGAKAKAHTKMQVVANVFFGRRQYVDILDCYLRRNLAMNGGLLDQVNFLVHGAHQEDVDWLEQMVTDPTVKGKYKIINDPEIIERGFKQLWAKYFVDPNTVYFKIDDDIVFIDDATIPRMVSSLLSHPEAHNVQANVVNNMGTHWFHFRTGAILPYLPDESEPSKCNTTWRASELPCYAGAESTSWKDFRVKYHPPFKHHRWLPMKNTPSNLLKTPMAGTLPTPDNKKCRKARMTWSTQAQVHYSFFDNLEQKKLSQYDYGNTEGLWNTFYKRYNINFMAIRGSTVSEAPFWGDEPMIHATDEVSLTIKAPKRLEKPVYVDTRALVSHYSFRGYPSDGLSKTDVLDRYRAYANEFVCGPKNQKVSFGKEIEKHGKDPIPSIDPDLMNSEDPEDSEDDDYDFDFE